MAVFTKGSGATSVRLDGRQRVALGASWDPSSAGHGGLMGKLRRKAGTDLDALAFGLSQGNVLRMAGLDSLDPFNNGSMVHSGDNQTGHGDGDDETITINLADVPGLVDEIVLVAAAYKKRSSFTAAQNIAFTVYDLTTGIPTALHEIWPSMAERSNACEVARLKRSGDAWDLTAPNRMGNVKQGDQHSLVKFAAGS